MDRQVTNRIGNPETAHAVESEAEYLQFARGFLLRMGMLPKAMYESDVRPPAYVSGGWWVCKCPCGNAPSAHPPDGTDAWPEPVAVCLECGIVYRPLFPEDWREAEAVLLERPVANRHYFPHAETAAWVGSPAQSVASLQAENRARGVGADR